MDASLARLQGEVPSDRSAMAGGSIGSTAEDIADNEEAVAAVAVVVLAVVVTVVGKYMPMTTPRPDPLVSGRIRYWRHRHCCQNCYRCPLCFWTSCPYPFVAAALWHLEQMVVLVVGCCSDQYR